MEQKFIDANKLLEDEGFLEKLRTVEDDVACSELFKTYGADLSPEDVHQMAIASQAAKDYGELNEEDLSNVAGGIVITLTTALCFIGGAAMIGFYSSYGYRSIKDMVKESKKSKKRK